MQDGVVRMSGGFMCFVKIGISKAEAQAKDLEPLMGNKGHESLVLAGKREITLKMAQRLREYFQLPAELYFGLRYSIVVIQGNGLNEQRIANIEVQKSEGDVMKAK